MEYHNNCLQPGHYLKNKYLIQERIGQGGFGVTYKAIHEGKTYAVKELFYRNLQTRQPNTSRVYLTDVSQEQTFNSLKKSFLKEAKILSKFIEEPGVVNLIDFFEENGTAYIIMDYVEGITLRQYVEERGKCQPEALIGQMIPLMRTLDQIHRKGVIHRDISPENIIINKKKELVLVDFGASRAMDGESKMTTLFKDGYSACEQYGQEEKQGPWSDVYSLFATMYFALTGLKPTSSVIRLMMDDLKMPSRLGIDVLPEIEKMLAKGMEVDYTHRYQNFAQVLEEIEEIGLWSEKSKRKEIPTPLLITMVLVVIASVFFLPFQKVKETYQEEDMVNDLLRRTLSSEEISDLIRNMDPSEEKCIFAAYESSNGSNLDYQMTSLNLSYKKNIREICESINRNVAGYICWKSLYLPLTTKDLDAYDAESLEKLIYEICARSSCDFYDVDWKQMYGREPVFTYDANTTFDVMDYNQENPVVITNLGLIINQLKTKYDISWNPYPLLGYELEKENVQQDRFPYAAYWFLTDADLQDLSYEELKRVKYEIWNQANQAFDVTDICFLQKDLQDYFDSKPSYRRQEGSRIPLTSFFLSYGDAGEGTYYSYLLPYSVAKYNLRLVTKHMIAKGSHDKALGGKLNYSKMLSPKDLMGLSQFDRILAAEEMNLEENLFLTNFYWSSYPHVIREGKTPMKTTQGEFSLSSEIADELLCQTDLKQYMQNNLYEIYNNTFVYRIHWKNQNKEANTIRQYNFATLTDEKEGCGLITWCQTP